MNHIVLGYGGKKRIAELFGVSAPTVWSALNFKTKSIRSEKIRKAALAQGGSIQPKSNTK